MTEEERPEAKEQEACFAAIREIVQEISRLMDAAYQQYSRLVEQVLNGSITEEREIERIMDGLVDFGDDPRLLELYKTLCRHVYYKYPALVGEHTALFRLQFEETEDGDISWWLYDAAPDYEVWTDDEKTKWCLMEPEALYDFIRDECQG